MNGNKSTDTHVVSTWWTLLLQNWRRCGIVLLVCSSGVGLAIPKAVQFLPNTNSPQISAQQSSVSLADYERLELGMTLTDAQATLGRAIEISRDERAATYKWVNNDGSEIMAIFKTNRLVHKQQLGLK